MSDAHGFTAENLLRSLPPPILEDKELAALAQALCEVLAGEKNNVQNIEIYSHIDELPEELLDILAKDFKVDWWDVNYILEEKRATLKSSWRVHQIIGTPEAVVTAISAIYPDTSVSEWWEYGGEPFHFRLTIDATYEQINQTKHARVMNRVQFYKNLRSILDGIEYIDAGGAAIGYAYATDLGCEICDGATAIRYEEGQAWHGKA